MTQDGQKSDEQRTLADLREQTRLLAEELPPPLRRIRVRSAEALVEVEWQAAAVSGPASPYLENALVATPSSNGRAEPVQQVDDRMDSMIIASPMVGTFYRTPEPGSAPYVSVGDTVEPGQVVGIVEAMKLMNPIVTEHAGTIEEILADNAAAVEFGQPLISLNVTAPGPTS